ncbi:MAG: acyl-CoA dehydrogenase family protein [Deltaproteobacteria bacterium]|nr:acyl-CoA dehydrogenase family protein [Deltaproteobacteria bacterium]
MANPNLKSVDLNKEKEAAMDVAEEAREKEWTAPSFMGEIFMGRFNTNLVLPYPEQDPEDKKIGDEFCEKLEDFLKKNVDPDEIDRTGEFPKHVIDGLAKLGAWGMKIPKEYGGLGLSVTNYCRALMLVGSYCGTTCAWLSAHQSIGVPTPLKMFGTEEQKKKFLPRLAKGEISAFALTEPAVGSDPAKMSTTAVPTEDGNHYIINGEKLWCTNGPVANIMVVMAKTPPKMVHGKEKTQITAFIVEGNAPGFETVHRCRFMGLNGIQNGLLRFNNVKVPKENIIWGLGNGLKLALITLNTGRLSLPAAAAGTMKQCLNIGRDWANKRVQWGQPIGRHETIALKLAKMAADTFAIESMVYYTTQSVDRGGADIRLEAAACKVYGSETCWNTIHETIQVQGGRGYERGDSLRARGEMGCSMERGARDFRVNLILEGSSEILRLFLAREALDPHMKGAMPIFDPRTSAGEKAAAALKTGAFYAGWYPKQWLHWSYWPLYNQYGKLGKHLRFIRRSSHRLARNVFHKMGQHQLGLEKREQTLNRLVNVGMELFAMSAATARAITLLEKNPKDRTPEELADLFCLLATQRIQAEFKNLWKNQDRLEYKTALKFLEGEYGWLERGILDAVELEKELLAHQSVQQRKKVGT